MFSRLTPLYVGTEVMLPPLVQLVFPNIWKLLPNHLNLKGTLVDKQLDVISDVTKIGLKKILVHYTEQIYSPIGDLIYVLVLPYQLSNQ